MLKPVRLSAECYDKHFAIFILLENKLNLDFICLEYLSSALRQVIILLPLASILGKAIGINGIWWSFLISETVTVILAIIYLGIAEKKELIKLRWNIQWGVVVILKTVHADRIAQNIDVFDFSLSDEDIVQIKLLDIGHSEIVNHFNPQWIKR